MRFSEKKFFLPCRLSTVMTRFLILGAVFMLLRCQSEPVTGEYGSWSFSGYVVDGATQGRLPGVSISYLDMDGSTVTEKTDKSSEFFINSLPFGARSFQFSYDNKDTNKTDYTSRILVASSYSESNHIDGLLGDVSRVVTLYPLTGSVSGELYLLINGSENTVPAKKLKVKIDYLDTNMVNSFPSEFTSISDEYGKFKLVKLPLAPGAILNINNMVYNGITYYADPVDISQLFGDEMLSLGRIFLKAKDTNNILISKVKSNVLSANGFGLSNIPVECNIWYVLPKNSFVKSTVSASLSDGDNTSCIVRTKGDTVFIDPEDKLTFDTLITVTITCQDSAGNYMEYVFDGAKRFRTEKKITLEVKSNVLSKDGYGLTGIPVDQKLWYLLPVTPVKSSIEVSINGKFSSDVTVNVKGDTLFVDPDENFNYDTLVTISFTGIDIDSNHIEYAFDGNKRFRTEKRNWATVKSNVLSQSGYGLSGIPVSVKLWYKLPFIPLPSTVTVSLAGGGSPNSIISVKKDTIFVEPSRYFKYDELITVVIKGSDTNGTHFEYVFDDYKQFKTEKNITAVESNTWRKPGEAISYFSLSDTLWVRFSEKLDKDVNKIDWGKSSALFSIYGIGPYANADVWINGDTLFARPDQRLAIVYGGTMGYKVNVVSASGKRSDSVDVIANIELDEYYIKWTNAKDALGNMRLDFGTLDSIVVVSNKPIAQIRGISSFSGKSVPSDLSLDNIRLKGDTIIYKPSLFLKPDSVYGIDFDVLFKDGNLRNDVLGVIWKTALKLQILSYDNRLSGGFRQFNVIGDSLTVKFSSPIDTNRNAIVPFRVNITDVRYRSLKSRVRWNSSLTVATIFNIDTFPAADFDASPAYTGDAVNTRAVKSVSFDLITRDGEQVIGFKPKNEDIELHTVRGLCVVDANFILNHDNRNRVDRGESTLNNFPLNGSVRITFNHVLDTVAMRASDAGLSSYAGIKDGSSSVASTITFSPDGKIIIITPDTNLNTASSYYVWLKNIPALGIANAVAINKDAGTFSGKSSNYNLLDKAFQAR